jgi:hypothetical protein
MLGMYVLFVVDGKTYTLADKAKALREIGIGTIAAA